MHLHDSTWLFQARLLLCLVLVCCGLLVGLLLRQRFFHRPTPSPRCMILSWQAFEQHMGRFDYCWGDLAREHEDDWWAWWDGSLVDTLVVQTTTEHVARAEADDLHLADTLSE